MDSTIHFANMGDGGGGTGQKFAVTTTIVAGVASIIATLMSVV